MAKVVLPLMSQQVRNKIGDVVFFRRGDWGINVARMRVKPANPRTANQQANRHNVGTLLQIYLGKVSPAGKTLYKYNSTTKSWTAITIASTETFGSTEKEAWEEYKTVSKKGYTLSGKYSFLSVNIKRLKAGENPLKTPTSAFNIAT
jgi:hypothetical protein